MKKIIAVGMIGMAIASVAYAACRTYTVIMPDGKEVVCFECCNNGYCNVTCN